MPCWKTLFEYFDLFSIKHAWIQRWLKKTRKSRTITKSFVIYKDSFFIIRWYLEHSHQVLEDLKFKSWTIEVRASIFSIIRKIESVPDKKYTLNAQEGICHFEHLFDYWLEHFLERERILRIRRTQPLLVMQSTAMAYFRWFKYKYIYFSF